LNLVSENPENRDVDTKLNLVCGQTLRIEISGLFRNPDQCFEAQTLFEVTTLSLERSSFLGQHLLIARAGLAPISRNSLACVVHQDHPRLGLGRRRAGSAN
jgi:hypothetical protein